MTRGRFGFVVSSSLSPSIGEQDIVDPGVYRSDLSGQIAAHAVDLPAHDSPNRDDTPSPVSSVARVSWVIALTQVYRIHVGHAW